MSPYVFLLSHKIILGQRYKRIKIRKVDKWLMDTKLMENT